MPVVFEDPMFWVTMILSLAYVVGLVIVLTRGDKHDV
jgi:hypothetical protein